MTEVIMIKYAELTTKKDNRKFFIKELVTNIRRKIDNIMKISIFFLLFLIY